MKSLWVCPIHVIPVVSKNNFLGNSSDEDDSMILSDFKNASKQELLEAGSHTPLMKALGPLELPIQEVEEGTERLQQTSDEPDNSARPVVSDVLSEANITFQR